MNKNLRNNLILVGILLLLVIIKVLNNRSSYTPSDKIFKGNKDIINKILLYRGDDSIELLTIQ